jgi:hypothetical protein
MNDISKVSASAATPAGEPSITSLKSQMSLYSQYANATGQAGADYKALQFAIQTHNVTEAQAAMARLRRDSQASGAAKVNASQDADGDGNASPGGISNADGNKIDTTA